MNFSCSANFDMSCQSICLKLLLRRMLFHCFAAFSVTNSCEETKLANFRAENPEIITPTFFLEFWLFPWGFSSVRFLPRTETDFLFWTSLAVTSLHISSDGFNYFKATPVLDIAFSKLQEIRSKSTSSSLGRSKFNRIQFFKFFSISVMESLISSSSK